MRNNRWYDCDPELSDFIEGLKHLAQKERDAILAEMKNLIMQYDEGLIDRHVADFPMDANKRRWYDRDPYSWLVINGLKYADKLLAAAVIRFVKESAFDVADLKTF